MKAVYKRAGNYLVGDSDIELAVNNIIKQAKVYAGADISDVADVNVADAHYDKHYTCNIFLDMIGYSLINRGCMLVKQPVFFGRPIQWAIIDNNTRKKWANELFNSDDEGLQFAIDNKIWIADIKD